MSLSLHIFKAAFTIEPPSLPEEILSSLCLSNPHSFTTLDLNDCETTFILPFSPNYFSNNKSPKKPR